ncbi:hypothetical protein BGZ92_006984 [Podila epicladia]|nr:hypothetical protein BGZ92_006984 [Podila epicladia]
MTNNDNLLILIQHDRKDLADLTRSFSKGDKNTRANNADKAFNQVIMMINGANTVIHPSLHTVDEGAELIMESIKRMKSLADDFDRLECMSFEDTTYPSIFNHTFNQFFDLWDHESRSVSILHDAMHDADFDLLGPRWQSIRQTTPLRFPVRSVLAPHRMEDTSAETTTPQAEGKEDETVEPLTMSQRMKQLLEQAEEALTKAKTSSAEASKASSSGGDMQEEEKLACGCTGTCTGACAKGMEQGQKLACGCTSVCSCPSTTAKMEE